MAFQLTIVHPKSDVLEVFSLAEGEFTLGQTAENDIVLSHRFVAAIHAQLTVTTKQVSLTDLASQSGTAVNSLRIPPQQPIPLNVGDVVEIAWFQLTLEETVVPLTEQPAAAQSKPSDQGDKPPNKGGGSSNGNNNNGDDDSNGDDNGKEPDDPARQLDDLVFEKNFSRYVQYLPAIYDTPFTHRFLGVFESLLQPIVWRIDNLDFYLDGDKTPKRFLIWLADWYRFTFDHTWTEAQQRQLLQAAPTIFGYWGTACAMQTVLDIYVGQAVTLIDDTSLPPFTFRVEVPLPPDDPNEANKRAAVRRLINQHKPAQTSFELIFTG